MSKDSLTVQPDSSLRVDKRPGDDTSALDAALSAMAEPVSTTLTQSIYRITAASIWQARRQGLSLAEILQTLETHSHAEIPPNVRADIELWSRQIDRLTLEADQGRLFLRSQYPLAITAVLRHRTLGALVDHQVDANTVELRPDTYPEVVQTFDAQQYPVLNRVGDDWNTITPPSEASPRRAGRSAKKSARRRRKGRPQDVSLPAEVPQAGADRGETPQAVAGPLERFDALRTHLPRQCQATTRAGRQCKNRAQPHAPFCHVHAELTPEHEIPDTSTLNAHLNSQVLDLMLQTGMITLEQMALARVGIGVVIGLGTWLLYTLLMWIGVGWFHLPLASWYTAGFAFVATCWLLGRMVAGIGLLTTMQVVVITLLSLLGDFFNKNGLILNICFVLIPFVLPGYILYRYALSMWWGFLLFPIGFVLGKYFYKLLEETSE